MVLGISFRNFLSPCLKHAKSCLNRVRFSFVRLADFSPAKKTAPLAA
jgi:hypothetical protein